MKKRKKYIPGLPPGILEDMKSDVFTFSILSYNEQEISEKEMTEVERLTDIREPGKISWVQVKEIQKSNIVQKIGNYFNLHPLVLEDIMDTRQQPKINDFEDYVFLVIDIPVFDHALHEMSTQQVSVVFGENYVITFQETSDILFLPVRERLLKNKGFIRSRKSDYLAYALIDLIVDHFFLIIEEMEERINTLEEMILSNDSPDIVHRIHKSKQVVMTIRKTILAAREIIRRLEKRDMSFVREETLPYLRDVYEHTIQIVESTEMLRETLTSIHDVSLSIISNRMNQVMKVLTIFASIFIPLTFLVGVYGMNFKYMPELQWPWAYPVLLGVMAITAGIMLIYFRRKKWIGKDKR